MPATKWVTILAQPEPVWGIWRGVDYTAVESIGSTLLVEVVETRPRSPYHQHWEPTAVEGLSVEWYRSAVLE